MPKALVLLNPHARSAQNQLEAVRRRLNRAPSEVLGEISPHRKLSDFRVLLDRFKDQMDFIIVGGGDGTLSQVVRLMKELQIDCPLGVLPMGTANTFAQNLNLPQAWEECVAIIEAGVTRSVDLASVNGVYFLNAAGMGLSCHVNRRIPRWLKKVFGRLAYLVFALFLQLRWKGLKVRVRSNGQEERVRIVQANIVNRRFIAGNFPVATDADLSDRRLHIRLLNFSSLRDYLVFLPRLLWGSPLHDEKNFRILETKSFTLETWRPEAIDLDREVLARTPAYFKLHFKALKVFVSKPLTVDQREAEFEWVNSE